MKEWLIIATEYAIVLIDAIALAVVVVATLEAFISALPLVLRRADGRERRDIWLRFARWLVAALTFQLAADIIETSITEDWTSVGRIAAVAVVRTFLNYFLERDVEKTGEEQRERRREQRTEPIA